MVFQREWPRGYRWAGYTLGFALAGFFDGILLHQILQWHHLLSNLDGAVFQNLRVQVLADGVFHLGMYIIAAAGLVLLWRERDVLARSGAGRLLVASGLLGFGAWHIVDAVLFHWTLQIHRIRMDADHLLLWDVIWLVPFGIVPFLVGWWLQRRPSAGGTARGAGAAASVLVLAVVVCGPIAARPPPDSNTVMVLFGPATSAGDAFAAMIGIGGRIVWHDPAGAVWAVHFDNPADARTLYRQGAWLVSHSYLAAGCFSWSRPPAT